MWIVRVALSRPYTFVVLALAILLVGPLTILRTPTDIFPNINIPVVAVVWNYGGSFARRWRTASSRTSSATVTTTVNDIEHIESQSLRGIVGREGLLPAGAQHRAGRRAGHRHLPVRAPAAAPGHQPAVHPQLQRVDGPGPAARAVGAEAVRAAALRPRGELPPHAAGDRSGRVRFRSPTAASRRRSRSTSTRRRCRRRAWRRSTSSTRSARRT